MKIYLIIILLGVVRISTIYSQEINIEISNKLNSPNKIYVNKFGDIYLCNTTQIFRLSKKGEVIAQYGVLGQKTVDGIDVSNPFKVLVFCKDFQYITILDRNLAIIENKILLQDFQLEFVENICWSNDDSFWVYDSFKKRFINIDIKLNIIKGTVSIDDIINSTDELISVKELSGYLYCFFKDYGIIIFDNLGNFIKNINLLNYRWADVVSMNQVIYLDKNQNVFLELNLEDKRTTRYNIKLSENFKDFFYYREKIYLLGDSTIYVKELNN